MLSFSISYLLTDKKKPLFWQFQIVLAVFWSFLPQFSKNSEYRQIIFSEALVHFNIFCWRLFQAFSVGWFAPKYFSTKVNSPVSALHFLFATIFHCLFHTFVHIPNWNFPINVVYSGENRLSISFFIVEESGCTLWVVLISDFFLGTRDRKYANTWGGGGRARGQKSF